MKIFCKKYWIYISAIFLPWIIVIIKCAASGLWMFGKGDILRGDMSVQLVPFYYELWNRVHNGDVSSYLWHFAGGIDAWTIMGYLFSPFSLIVLLMPYRYIADAVQIVMVLKWSAIFFGMVFFFYNTRYNKLTSYKGAVSLLLGCAYAFNNGIINFVGYIQLNDVLILFPFLMLLVEKMADEKKWKLYYILLSLGIIMNAYMAFEVCIMLLLWFVFNCISNMDDLKHKLLIFIGSSLLAGVNAVAILIPGTMSYGDRFVNASGGDMPYLKSILLTPGAFIKQLFIFTKIGKASDIAPNIFFSIVCLVLSLFFFFININKKEKRFIIGISGFLTMSFFFGILSIVWHCFIIPNNIYHRFSNFFVFILLFMVLIVLVNLDQITRCQVVIVGVVSLIIFIITFFSIPIYSSVVTYMDTLLLLVFYIIILYLFAMGSIRYKGVIVIVFVMGMAELVANAYYVFDDYSSEVGFRYRYEAIQKLSQDIRLKEGECYSCPRFVNSGLVLSKNTEDAFITGINSNNQRLHAALGMPVNGQVEYSISGASPLINLIYNIAYTVGLDEMTVSDSDYVRSEGELSLFKTRKLAGIAYMVSDNVIDWRIQGNNCFEIQNDYVRQAAGTEDIFDMIKPIITPYSPTDGDVLVGKADNEYACLYRYQHNKGGVDDYIQFDIDVEEYMDLYAYITYSNAAYISVLVDGKPVHTDQVLYQQQTVHVGNVSKGQQVSIVVVEPYSNQNDIEDVLLYFAKFDDDAYKKAYEKMSANVIDINGSLSDCFEGDIHVDKKGVLMTSIQAATGWKAYVDDKQVEYNIIADTLIGVPLAEGDHTVRFEYKSNRLFICMGIIIIDFALFAIICIIDKVKNIGKMGE